MAKIKKRIKSIKVDLDKCNGCRACEVVCSAFHAEPKYSSNNPERSRIRLIRHPIKDVYLPVYAGEYTASECMGRDKYVLDGKEYDECDDLTAKRDWRRDTGLGREKIFEVRRIHNDLTFIDTFLTLDFCREHKLFSFGYNEDADYYEIESREFPKIKQRLLFSLTNRGQPLITVRDGNYKNRGELFLSHAFNGVDLQMDYARDTLRNLARLWTRPVHIETLIDETPTLLSFDGREHTQTPAASN